MAWIAQLENESACKEAIVLSKHRTGILPGTAHEGSQMKPSYTIEAKDDGTWLFIDGGGRYKAMIRLEAIASLPAVAMAVRELRALLLDTKED